MKRTFAYIVFAAATISALADSFIKNPSPAILEVRYIRTEVTDTTRRDSAFHKDEMMLRIGKDMSIFCSVKRYAKDSLSVESHDAYLTLMLREMEKGNPHLFSSLGGTKSSYLYKYYNDNKVIEEDYFDMTPWRSTEEWEKPVWDMHEETKDILGYECFKATTDFRGRKWTAWFAPEIPVQEGPWKLCGLPGLILEAYDSANDYTFEGHGIMQTGLGNVGYCNVRKIDDYENVTREQFHENWWKFKHSNSNAKMKAAFGFDLKSTGKSPAISYDKEETDYPHDL